MTTKSPIIHAIKGGIDSKKGDDAKSKDSDTTTTSTAGAHIGEVTTPQDSTAPSKGASIGAHVSEIAQQAFCPAGSVKELLAAHPVNDAIWSHSNPSDVSIDTANSAEIITGSHITEGLTYAFDRSDPYELIDTASHVSHKDDMSWYDRSAFLNSFTDSSKSEDTIGDDDVTNDSATGSIKSDFCIGERQS